MVEDVLQPLAALLEEEKKKEYRAEDQREDGEAKKIPLLSW